MLAGGTIAPVQAWLFEVPAATPDPDRRTAARLFRLAQAERRLRAREYHAVAQPRLPWVDMPRTVGDCRGPGICPVLRCKFNLALWVKSGNGSIKVGRAHEKGRTLKNADRASEARMEAMADLVVQLADQLESLCVLDYTEHGEMNYVAIGRVLGCTKQRARTLVLEAQAEWSHAVDIEEAKARRQARVATGARSPLVQIRQRPGVMRPTARELQRVGD